MPFATCPTIASHMARLPRFVIPGQPQHIIKRGHNRQALFGADADYRFFCGTLVEAATQQGLAIHAYVWMTYHIHVLVTPESGQAISKVFQSVGRRYVHYFNAAYGRGGTLWEGRYRATVVDSERYIELNSVRAGRVTDPANDPWSSYRHPALGEPGPNADGVDAASGVFATGAEPAGAGTCLPTTVPYRHCSCRSSRHPGPLAQGLGTRQRAVQRAH